MKWVTFLFIIWGILVLPDLQAQTSRQYFRAGEDFLKANNYQDAIEQFSKSIELDPDAEKAYISRAYAYSRLGAYEKAAEDYDRAIVFNEKDEELYYLSGNQWFAHGNLQFALIKLNQAIQLKSKYLEAYRVRLQVYMALSEYEKALEDGHTCLKLREDELAWYHLAKIYEKLGKLDEAEEAYRSSLQKNRRVLATHFDFAELLYSREKYDQAGLEINQVLQMDPRYLEGILLQSQILVAQKDFLKASEILSVASVEYPEESRIYAYRGDIQNKLNQPGYAIIDYSKAIELDPENAQLYYLRAGAYEAIRDYEKALADYDKLLAMSKYDGTAQRLHEQATQRMFELNREENKPLVSLIDPVSDASNTIDVSREVNLLNLTGLIEDESPIASLQVNGFTVPVEEREDGYRFLASVNLSTTKQITVQVSDVYENTEIAIFPIRFTEVDAPLVHMIAPYGSENNILYLDNNDPTIYVEGRIEDESRIRSIYVDSVMASYIPSDLNPTFTAMVKVLNKSKLTIHVEDEYGNRADVEYRLNRDAQSFENNPMGKTWAVFIENSDYRNFASLEGPGKDVSQMRAALARYQVHNVIHRKNLSKAQLSKFFSIELRDMIRSNRVNSILIWYAGHGKYVDENGYWIPVDASRDDEFTYYDIKALKAAMQGYPDFLNHTLVVTDACESGPSFYQAMRSGIQEKSCDDWTSTRFKSSQVFSSAGYELAVDNSQFTRTFARTLENNEGSCLPIENIVLKVIPAVENSTQQTPEFGKIAGLEDEDGTFFFIPKDY